MAHVAKDLIDTLLQRVRDPQGAAHPRAFTLSLLSRLHQMVNLGVQAVVESTTLATEPLRQVYPVQALVPRAARVVGVREGDRDLFPVSWETLRLVDGAWHRAVGDSFEVWSRIGPDLLVIHPAKTVVSSVDIISVVLTTEWANENALTEIPTEAIPLLLDAAEAVLLVRQREYAGALDLAGRMKQRFLDARRPV